MLHWKFGESLLQTFSQTFTWGCKFAWKFHWNFQGCIASLLQTFKAGLQVWCKLSRLDCKFDANFQGWIETFNLFIFCFLFFLWCFLVVKYVCCWHMHGFTGFNFARSHVFFLGTWIGSNDLMISSACVTDFFWHKSMATMSKGHKRNETRLWQEWKILAMKRCPSMHSVLESSVRASFQRYHCFLVFLVKDFGSQSLTISAQSLLNPFGFFDVMPHTCPARHELTHLPLLILGEVGLATMQDHATALLPLNGCGYCLERHHLLSELFKACWLP